MEDGWLKTEIIYIYLSLIYLWKVYMYWKTNYTKEETALMVYYINYKIT